MTEAGLTPFAYGNDPAKIARYRAFWECASTGRPLVGFTLTGWFPLREFAACRSWQSRMYLEPDMIEPEEFLDDHLRLLAEGNLMQDDLIRGACPAQLAFPWLPGMLSCPVRILPDTIVGEERRLDWAEALSVRLDSDNGWFRKYLEFADALVRRSGGAFPVSHSAEIGPTDLHALLRGHTQSLLDLIDEPAKSAALLSRLGGICRELTDVLWKRLPLFHGGYFDAQYSLWAPGPIIRMQEDATAVYSPALYRRFVQPVDRGIASHYPCSFIHLHSTSMFLLDAFLAIEEIRCFEVNQDALGPPVAQMIPHFRKVQRAGRPLLIKGAFPADELKLVLDSLDPRGLFLNVMIDRADAAGALRRAVGM
jgi:hypothetical protein